MAILVTRYRKLWRDYLKRTPYPVNVPPRAWDKYFPAETEQLRKIPEFEISKISIDGLRKLATRLPTGTDSNRALFVATMMWGRGPKNGRMMPNFQVAASHREFDKTLSITRESVMQGDLSGAYSQWLSSGIKGIREPFFTKWLFVCGLKNDPGVLQAFTLDGRVRASLRTLEWPDAPLKKTLQGKPALLFLGVPEDANYLGSRALGRAMPDHPASGGTVSVSQDRQHTTGLATSWRFARRCIGEFHRQQHKDGSYAFLA